jgi:predicted 2-oxoglutarate/Fe(II)-dependent dioxygenase YbiX
MPGGVLLTRFYSARVCESFIKSAERLNRWKAARVIVGRDKVASVAADRKIRKARYFYLRGAARLLRTLDAGIRAVALPVVEREWGIRLTDYDGAQMVRYEPGDHYIPHADSGPGLENRYFTILCYLNDGFDGGETFFSTLKYSVMPKRARVVIFPSEYVHCAMPVLAGRKYVLVCWLTGPVSPRWI